MLQDYDSGTIHKIGAKLYYSPNVFMAGRTMFTRLSIAILRARYFLEPFILRNMRPLVSTELAILQPRAQ